MTTSKKKIKCKLGSYDEATYKKLVKNNTPTWELDLPPVQNDELPTVSIVTITKNRAHMANLMLYNWRQVNYPKDKLEWIIVDDSDTDELRYYLPLLEDTRIHYVYCKDGFDSIAEKRNYACSLASYEMLALVDDDDYYFPDHILAKARVLKHYNKQGVHSIPIAVYDVIDDHSFIFDWTKKGKKYNNNISEASVMMRKSYWEKHNFKSSLGKGMNEGQSLVEKRFGDWIKIHFLFNTISLSHNKNITVNNRRLNDDLYQSSKNSDYKIGDFKQVFPDTFLYILQQIKAFQDAK